MTANLALITGLWSSTHLDNRFNVDDPATGRTLAEVHGAGPEQVDAAVRAAHAAQPAWRRQTPRTRGAVLRTIAGVIRDHAEELARIESQENGKPLVQARFDLAAASSIFDLFSSLTEATPGTVRDAGPLLDITMLEPYGVVAAILPFNWPPIVTAGKMAAALAVGNGVVIKPPEQAPLSVIRMVELVAPVLPAGLVQVVPGGSAVGASLAGHPLIGKVSFTGAPGTGIKVIKAAADNLTPTLMELGGKNPFVVFADADLDSAVRWALEGGYYNQGEACSAASRILVHSSIYNEFADRLAAAVARLCVGAPDDPGTDIGPMVTAAHQRSVLNYIDLGIKEGAVIAAQAPLPASPDLASGFYVPPTLFTDVTPDMRIATEEIFGPVVGLIRFDSEDDAIQIANATPFGLMAGVFTADSQRLIRVGRAISAGVVFLNQYSRQDLFGTPFGGTKHSGYGRLHAQQTLGEFGQTKSLRMPSGNGEVATLPFGDRSHA